ncbi:MAG: hypothetical protein LKE40_09130 [Spirochaetia bacterium]|jgi:hypothetical protein|nr:hypothetical protein [Spirochaetia bacterium]
MKKGNVQMTCLLCFVASFFIGCNIGTDGVGNNIDDIPGNLKTVKYINYTPSLGDVSVTDDEIDITITENSADASEREFQDGAREIDTGDLLVAGYTLDDAYQELSGTCIYTLVCTKPGADTLTFVFDIYHPYDTLVYKFVGNEEIDLSTATPITFLTWTDS